jgi:hypothetical protein
MTASVSFPIFLIEAFPPGIGNSHKHQSQPSSAEGRLVNERIRNVSPYASTVKAARHSPPQGKQILSIAPPQVSACRRIPAESPVEILGLEMTAYLRDI